MSSKQAGSADLGSVPVPGRLSLVRPKEGVLLLELSGAWKMGEDLPSAAEVRRALEADRQIGRLAFDAGKLTDWDSGLVIFLLRAIESAEKAGAAVDREGLPEGVQRLMALAAGGAKRQGARKKKTSLSPLARFGSDILERKQAARELLEFLGSFSLALLRLVTGKARFRRSELFLFIQQSGSQAFVIVSLISFLVGVILAFVGAVQLRMFGAEIFVADLVGIGMARDMGAMMTGIIMAGRTGSAFAAQLGTMQVNEEIDSLKTLGISPMEFLVLPRMLALVLMMPLLTCYADLMGTLGGALVGVGMFGLTPMQYYLETKEAVPLTHFEVGLIKSLAYGVIVALAGCLRGMQCGRSASAVGDATTSAVVTAIVWIVVWCAILTVVFHVLGI